MVWLFLFLIEIIVLFFLSQVVTRVLSLWFLSLTRSQNITIQLLSLLFFPGVVVHELAHWFMAGVMLVRTGEIEFLPKILAEGTVKLGSVAIAKTDPMRRFLIGIAPVIIGILLLFLFFSLASSFVPKFNWQTLLLIYGFFEIGNTMFSSKKDMEGALGLFIGLFIIGVVIYFFGFRININIVSILSFPPLVYFFQKVDILLLVPIGVDIVLWMVSHMLRRRVY